MVQLIVTVTTQQGRAGDYIAAFNAMAPRVRAEAGCLEYGIFVDSSDPRFDNEVRADTVVLCEKWESIEALQHHTKNSPALTEFRELVKDIKLGSGYRLLRPAGGS